MLKCIFQILKFYDPIKCIYPQQRKKTIYIGNVVSVCFVRKERYCFTQKLQTSLFTELHDRFRKMTSAATNLLRLLL